MNKDTYTNPENELRIINNSETIMFSHSESKCISMSSGYVDDILVELFIR